MISVAEASEMILRNNIAIEGKMVPLDEANGEILLEDLTADRDFPPYHRVTMDGIAIKYAAFEQGVRTFPIEAVGAAGAPRITMKDSESCIEIMTGAILPDNTDTVIRYEDLEIKDGKATFLLDELKYKKNVHRKGEDCLAGEVLVKAGVRISPAEIGIAATIGKTHLKVADIPRAVIISTGDELVDVGESPLEHQIRKSNVHQLKATMEQWGIQSHLEHLADEKQAILEKLEHLLKTYKLIVMSGGVSKGKFDYIPEALEQLGVKKLFHRVKQRPGKPFWFGVSPSGSRVFALPGNPVSTFMCAHRYVHSWLKESLGMVQDLPFAILAEDYYFKPDLTYYLQVKLEYRKDGSILAHPQTGNGSGDHANLATADAFLEIPAGREHFKAGEIFPFMKYRG
ncbi:MAG: molybdopterin molybdenumtransferase MoeA [Bacteroidetes bacterium]|nr:MAG: molybdopterin molybdenumtransferase MoeA [Bacteroidota bacterium]